MRVCVCKCVCVWVIRHYTVYYATQHINGTQFSYPTNILAVVFPLNIEQYLIS